MQLWGRVLEDGYNGRSWRGCQGLLHGRRGTVAGGEFVDAAPRERVEFVNASMLRQRDGTGAGMLRPLLHCCGKVAPRYPCWTLKKEELPRGGDVGVAHCLRPHASAPRAVKQTDKTCGGGGNRTEVEYFSKTGKSRIPHVLVNLKRYAGSIRLDTRVKCSLSSHHSSD